MLGAASAAIGTALALLLALAFRRDFPFKNAVFQLVLLPIIVPSAVLGSALLVLFWDMVAEKVSPEAPAVAVIIIVLSVVASLPGYAVAGRSGRAGQAGA